MTDTNQASKDELDKLIDERVKIASTETKSEDEVVQIAWIADGIDIWHRSKGKRGHGPARARRYIISSVTRLIRTEKLKLLAEVREQQIPVIALKAKNPHDEVQIQAVPIEALTKLEAEL